MEDEAQLQGREGHVGRGKDLGAPGDPHRLVGLRGRGGLERHPEEPRRQPGQGQGQQASAERAGHAADHSTLPSPERKRVLPVRGGRASLACSRDETDPRRGGARRPRPSPLRLRPRPRARGPARRRRPARRGLGRRRGPRGDPRGLAARPARERRHSPRLPRRPSGTPALRAGHTEGGAAPARLRHRPPLPRAARGRVRGEGEGGLPRGRRLDPAPRPDLPTRGPRLGPGGRGPREAGRPGARAGARDARLRAGGRPGARLVGHARDHRRPQGAPRDRLPRGHAAGRPHRRLRLRAEDDPRARRLREGRGRLRRGDRARLVDEAVGGLDPHVEAPGAAQGRAAARPARPLERHDRPAARRAGLGDRRRHRQLGDLRRRVGVRPRLRRLRRAARRRRRAEQAGRRRRRGGLGPRLPALAAGLAHVPLRPHDGPARPLRAAPALRPDVRALPDRGAPRARPAHRLQGAARPGAHDRAVRRRHRVRGPRVRPLRAGAEGGGAVRGRARRLSRRPRRGVPGPRALAPRPQPLRRAHPRPAPREAPRQPRGGPARGRAGAGARRRADRARGDGPAAPPGPRRAAAAADARRRRVEAAPRARRDLPPRLRGATGRARRATSTSAASAPTTTSSTSTSVATRRSRRASPGSHPERVRLLQAQSEAGMSPNPFRYVVEVAGRGPLRAQAGDAGLARGGRGDRPRAGRALEPGGKRALARAEPAAAPRRAARDRLHRAPRGGAGHARRHARRAAPAAGGRRGGRELLPPRGDSRSACPTSSPRPTTTAASTCSPPRPRARPACGSGSPCPRAGRSRRWTRRRARG